MILSSRQYGATGTATPVIMLHAFPVDSRMWVPLASMLRDRPVVTMDLRGFGQSPAAPANQPWSVGMFADDVMETVQSLGFSDAVFCGCSMGGYVIFELWRRRPQAVRGMILCDTRPDADTDEIRERRAAQIDRVRKEGTGFLCDFATTQLPGQTTRRDKPALIGEIADWARGVPPDTIIRTLQVLATRPDSRPHLSGITAPVLALAGDEDTVTPPDVCGEMAAAIPGAAMAQIPAAGHLAPLENPQATCDAVSHFLTGLRTS